MKHAPIRLSLVFAAAAAGGLLLGSSDEDDGDEFEWEMFGQRIAVGEGPSPHGDTVFEGTSFLYNKRTGEVYRIFLGCGDLGINGCLEALPVVGNGMFPSAVPPSRSSANQIRR